MQKIEKLFKGEFLTNPKSFRKKIKAIKAYIFDWDGVFNDGHKTETGSSSFSEIDSMGLNMLRFGHYLKNGDVPFTAIISGEQNKTAELFVKRESINAIYSGIKNKYHALDHFCRSKDINASEVAFIFDDVLDLSIAQHCGLRIMVPRQCNPLFLRFVKKKGLADYFTYSKGSENAVREAAELIMALHGEYDNVIQNRIDYSQTYQDYLEKRNASEPQFYKKEDLITQ